MSEHTVTTDDGTTIEIFDDYVIIVIVSQPIEE